MIEFVSSQAFFNAMPTTPSFWIGLREHVEYTTVPPTATIFSAFLQHENNLTNENNERDISVLVFYYRTVSYVKIADCNSGICNLSRILCGLKMLFSSECNTCLSVVQGTSTKIY